MGCKQKPMTDLNVASGLSGALWGCVGFGRGLREGVGEVGGGGVREASLVLAGV
jgi:hypothetical protein